MTENVNWDYVKDFYKECFGIQGWVVELYANLDILQLCASGASNTSIVNFSDLDLEDVVEVLLTTFKFKGWEQDLPVNPYKIYNELFIKLGDEGRQYLEGTFKYSLKNTLGLYPQSPQDVDVIYEICKTMKEIEERIQNEWI